MKYGKKSIFLSRRKPNKASDRKSFDRPSCRSVEPGEDMSFGAGSLGAVRRFSKKRIDPYLNSEEAVSLFRRIGKGGRPPCERTFDVEPGVFPEGATGFLSELF